MRVAILGASGSIGTQALDVCRQHADKLSVVTISVNSSTERAVAIAREFGVSHVVVTDETHLNDPVLRDLPAGCDCSFGPGALEDVAWMDDVDCVLNAVVGAAGIHVGYAALKAGKVLTYANKESIVIAGDLLMPLAKPGMLVPLDSEHSAIFQCLVGERHADIHCLWLTCSGGPFYGLSREELSRATAAQALRHPTWTMGPKITIDSATLMNKGLEIIEAHHLFDVPIDDVRVLVQRQSRIHSMVEFADGVVKAQLGPSDMRIPIQYAFSYPERWATPSPRVDYAAGEPLTFGEADESTFRCLALAKHAGRVGGTLPCAMNAANEVANLAFREDRCGFLDIERTVEAVMGRTDVVPVESVEQLAEVDAWARQEAESLLGGHK
ncbi:MAG: 1-deoxy-D-xylulose-5-phosphate reductoisomerase [Olsenella sp.]|jgi:1-deoxy-D-xylulose-5-phosphate reductoisomerase|nr:1-deoxy-D-xylulose-5-phosphate reductoisomerase [Olsenella sp.]